MRRSNAAGGPPWARILLLAQPAVADTHELPDTGSLSLCADSIRSSTDETSHACVPDARASEISGSSASAGASEPGFVPPPLASDIDTLLEAVAAAGRSPVQKSAGDWQVRDATSLPVRGGSAFLRWRPAINRGVAPSIAAFLLGAIGALWGLRALPRTSPVFLENSQNTTDVVTARSASPPLVVVNDSLPPDLVPLPPTVSVRAASPAALQQGHQLPTVIPPARTTTNPTSNTEERASSPPTLASGAIANPSGGAPIVLGSDSRAQPSTLATLPVSPRAADLEAHAVPQPTAAPAPAFPDPTATIAERAPIAAEPPLAVTELAPVADRSGEEEHGVRRALQSYEAAYEELDVMAAVEVWPSVDRRALSRAFATLKSQGLDFESCAITVSDSQATVSCDGTLEVVRKVGNAVPLKADQHWVFKMRRLAGMWKIDQVSTSQAPVNATHRLRGEG